MPNTRPPYSPEFCRQMVDLVRAGRSPRTLPGSLNPELADRDRSRVVGEGVSSVRREGCVRSVVAGKWAIRPYTV